MAGILTIKFQDFPNQKTRATTPFPLIAYNRRYRASAFPTKYYYYSSFAYEKSPRRLKSRQNSSPRRVLSRKRPTSVVSSANYTEFEYLKGLGNRCEDCKKVRCGCAS